MQYHTLNLKSLKLEPVRVYMVLAALVAVATHYIPDLPSALILAVAAAVLGVAGETVRNRVTPTDKFPMEIL